MTEPIPTNGGDGIFQRLEQLSERMLALVQRQELEAIDPLAREATELILQAYSLPAPLSEDDARRLQHARELQQHLRLALASQRDEIGQQIGELAHGRKSIHAYRLNEPDRHG